MSGVGSAGLMPTPVGESTEGRLTDGVPDYMGWSCQHRAQGSPSTISRVSFFSRQARRWRVLGIRGAPKIPKYKRLKTSVPDDIAASELIRGRWVAGCPV